MKIIALVASIVLLIAHSTQHRTQNYDLPVDALIVETQPVKSDRMLVLWMLSPTKHPRQLSPDEPYTCPEETRGSYYTGRTRVSLVDTQSRHVINTVEIRQEYIEGKDSFDIPYKIHSGSYYHVKGVPKGREGKPIIMRLKDYNGDGKALEFALFDALFCMGLQTTLIGYSERQDKVIQYPIHIEVINKDTRLVEVKHWVDYLFSEKPKRPGYWEYEIDYRGRGGLLDKYKIHYNKQAERFEGKVVYTEDD